MAGRMNAVAQWFQQPREAVDKFEREEMMAEASRFTRFAVRKNTRKGNTVWLLTPNGRFSIDVMDEDRVLLFTYAPNVGAAETVTFWFNASSVKHLGNALRAAPEKRIDADVIFCLTDIN